MNRRNIAYESRTCFTGEAAAAYCRNKGYKYLYCVIGRAKIKGHNIAQTTRRAEEKNPICLGKMLRGCEF